MNLTIKQSFGAQLSRIEGKIGETASWPSPGTGLAFHILQFIDDGQPHWPQSVKLSFPEGQLDTAPLIAAAGYSMCVAAPNSDQSARWQSALHRFTKREPFPRDRQTFAFRPSELVAVALGISKSNVGCSPTTGWIRSVVETLPTKNPAQDLWTLLIHHYTAALVGLTWPASLPSRLTDYELPELCLLYALLDQGKIPQPADVDSRRLAKAIVQRAVAITQDVREPEKLAALVAGISLALRGELDDFDTAGANPAITSVKETRDSQRTPFDDSSRPLVVLVHGIRTSGKWIRRIKPVLESEGGCVVEPAGFGFFDIFRFLLPGPTRKEVIETVRWKLLHAVDRHKGRPLVIVAHSFGTFCVTEILKVSPQIRPVQLVFCGSIVAQNFRWDSLSQMAPDRGMLVVNECGARDIWPPLAHSVTFGYGSSGTGGFQVPGVEDRCHDLGHSGYFTKKFVRQFWVPFIKDGTIIRPEFEEEMPEAPWWISIIGFRPILPWLLWIVLVALAYVIVLGSSWGLPKSPERDFKHARNIELLSTGVSRDFVHSVIGTPNQETEFPFPGGVAELFVRPESRTLVGYQQGKLVLLAIQPFDRAFKEQIRMPKAHLAVELDFKLRNYSDLEVSPDFWTREFDAWLPSPIAVPTARDFRYGEYWHFWGPHFDQCALAISTATIFPNLLESANEGEALRREFTPNVIAYFPIDLLWTSDKNFNSQEPLQDLGGYLSEKFELISY